MNSQDVSDEQRKRIRKSLLFIQRFLGLLATYSVFIFSGMAYRDTHNKLFLALAFTLAVVWALEKA